MEPTLTHEQRIAYLTYAITMAVHGSADLEALLFLDHLEAELRAARPPVSAASRPTRPRRYTHS